MSTAHPFRKRLLDAYEAGMVTYYFGINRGEVRVTLRKESVTFALKPGQKPQGAHLDRFGLFTSTSDGRLVKIYFDDLIYTSAVRN